MGLDATDYDFNVFRITSEITKQVFPLTLNLDDPRFHTGLETLRKISVATEAAKARGGLVGGAKRLALGVSAGVAFARLYCLPTRRHELPQNARLAPTW
jgi:magnesium-protoporphyrin IX monomethyl ester (oxidative) cyclase